MQPIVPSLNPGDTGSQVANLIEALLLLVERGVIRALDAPNRPTADELRELAAKAREEMSASAFGGATARLIACFQVQQGLGDNLRGQVEEKTAARMNELLKPLGAFDNGETWIVRGTVTAGGRPKAGITVEACDRDLRTRQLLGRTVTGPDGRYVIEYTLADFQLGDRAERPSPWLIVAATAEAGEGVATRATFEKSKDVQREETVDLTFETAPVSEWERIFAAVLPLLAGQGPDGTSLSAFEITAGDIDFIVADTGLDPGRVRVWVLAATRARDVELLPKTAPLPAVAVLGADSAVVSTTPGAFAVADLLEWVAFYGWFRDGQPTAFADLVRRPSGELMTALDRASAQRRIPGLPEPQRDLIRRALENWRVRESLRPASDGEPASLGDLLNSMKRGGLPADLRDKTAVLLQEVPVESSDFMARFEPLIPDEAQRQELRRTLRLGDLTMKHTRLVEALQPVAATAGDDSLRALASIPPDRWLDLAYEHGVPPHSSITAETYARQLEESVETLAPTAALARTIETDTFFRTAPGYSALVPTLQQHAAFDVVSGDIEAFSRQAGLDEEQGAALRTLQRVKGLGASWEEASTLLEHGIDSSAAVTDLGVNGFRATLGDRLDEERILKIYDEAREIHAASVGMMSYLYPVLFGVAPAVMQSVKDNPEAKLQIENNPTLRGLFGALDNCACDPCLSVLSPAAYFVDLLKFVDASCEGALVLRDRRPDLYDLDLSCDNSRIELPHIDLVNEILENKVALPKPIELPPNTNIVDELKRNPLREVIRAALQLTAVDTLGDLVAVPDRWTRVPLIFRPGVSWWVVTDRHRRWVLEASAEYFGPISILPCASLDLTGVDMAAVVQAMDAGSLPHGVAAKFRQALIDSQRAQIPVAVESFTIAPDDPGKRWKVDFTLAGVADIRADQSTLILSDSSGREDKHKYSKAALEAAEHAFAAGQPGPIIGALDQWFARHASVKAAGVQWRYRSSFSLSFVYNRASLTIRGLTYQNTTDGEDLLARPQNRNPLAYQILNSADARFPWSLPYDADLEATRALLAKAGVPRLALLELATGAEQRTSSSLIAHECLGLGPAEAAAILNAAAGDYLWAAWGLRKNVGGASPYVVFDSFADKEVAGAARTLLSRASILMQQARVSFSDLRLLLGTAFVNPTGQVRIEPDHLCDPTQLSIVADATLFDRLHRFVRLWRATGWQVADLDRALQTALIAPAGLDDAAVRNIALIARVAARLHLPVETILTWFGGFTKQSHEGLFLDRRLSETVDEDLAFDKVPQTPPSARSLTDKAPLLSAALGLRASVWVSLVNSPFIDPAGVSIERGLTRNNLTWMYRNVGLMNALGLSLEEYEAAWRVRGGTPFASPADLLALLDDVDVVVTSGARWSELEYVLQGTDDASTEHDYPVAAAMMLLAQVREAVAAPEDPAAASVAHFGLASADLTGVALSAPPPTPQARWERWGLKPAPGSGGLWTVANPDTAATNPTLSGAPLTLLSALTVLAQQAHASPGDVRNLLQTRFVAPAAADQVTVQAVSATDSTLVVRNLTAVHLDRLERLVALWRATGLPVRELDEAVQSLCETNAAEPLDDDLQKLVEQGPAIAALRSRLVLPLDTVLAWRRGLGGRSYKIYAPDGVASRDDPGVFDRLFGQIAVLALNAGRDRLAIEDTPPSTPPTWHALAPDLAKALGASPTDLEVLCESGAFPAEVTLGSLGVLHRTVTLAQALSVSLKDFNRLSSRFARAYGQEWHTTAVSTLAFVEAATSDGRRVAALTSKLALAFHLDEALVSDLLWDGLDARQGTKRVPAMEILLDSTLLAEGVVDPAAVPETPEYGFLVRLHKLGLLNATWNATPAELRWLWSAAPAPAVFAGLALNALPVGSGDPAAAFVDWRRSTTLFMLAHSASGISPVVGAYLVAIGEARSQAELDAGFAVLGTSLGLPAVSAAATVAAFARMLTLDALTGPPTPAPQLDPIPLARLFALLSTGCRLGLDAAAMTSLVADPVTADTSEAARTLLRARFSDGNWAQALRAVSDTLREAQRDRLVDYLLWREGLRDANALYERYLIDVQMAPCMQTTRLLQGVAAVQLFVQRALFNLERERGVAPESIRNRDRWEWMRNYRVWQANRRVFLYPENWLFPELRDDRSDTFRPFESALTQSEPSHENAVQALKEYLDGLIEVSRISVMAMYEETVRMDAPGSALPKYQRTLYLVGRSPDPPYRFFWRRAFHYGEPGMRWSGWEYIDLDLSGDHVIPFVVDGDFHVAWPLIKRVTSDKDYFEVQLAWAHRTSTGWTRRKVSRGPGPTFPVIPSRDERSMFAFRAEEGPEGPHSAAIRCYVAKADADTVQRTPPEKPNELQRTGSSASTIYPGNKTVYLNVRAFSHVTNPERYTDVPVSTFIYIDGAQSFSFFFASGSGTVNVPNAATSVTVHVQDPTEGESFPWDMSTEGKDSVFSLSINVVFERGQNPVASDVNVDAALPMESTGAYVFDSRRDVEWRSAALTTLTVPPGVYAWSSGVLEQGEAASTGLQGVFSTSSPSGRFFATAAARSSQSLAVDSDATWYVEEDDSRFFVKLDPSGTPPVSALLPSGFTDALDYKVEYFRDSDSLFDPASQEKHVPGEDANRNTWFGVDSLTTYLPASAVLSDLLQRPTLAFDLRMPNALYNWEVFVHAPLAVARFLSNQHRFEDARRWLHDVFDPTTNDPAPGRERFWKALPFRHANQAASTARLLELLSDPLAPESQRELVRQQVSAWLEDPFNPFAVARLRTSAFEWYTVIAYVKNLMAWGDELFRRDTRESVNEATLLYVLAATILGRRPERIGARSEKRQPLSYRALEGQWDEIGNVWQKLADHPLVAGKGKGRHQSKKKDGKKEVAQLSSIGSLYFCVPPNEALSELWDMVEDRLFNIRHCRNIEGVRRDLPLLDPPIDPELLIRARAAGLDLGDVLSDLYAPLPQHRFQVLLQKANELCAEVKNLGAALLSALEKKEAEHLSLLRSEQEIDMLKLVELVKIDQVREAGANIEALQKTRRNALDRFAYLQRQLGKSEVALDATGAPIVEQSLMVQVQETGAPDDFRSLALIKPEIDEVWRLQDGHVWSMVAGAVKAAAGVSHAVGVYLPAKNAAEAIGFGLSAVGDGLGMVATNASFWERRAALIAGWQRRRDEWVQQSKMAAEEVRQIDKQIVALEIRKAIGEKELANHRKQVEFASDIDDFLRHVKFSGESLYGWMESQLSGLYFTAYQVAYDFARRAERAFRFELGDETASFVRYGVWDNLRKGLLSGERLANDLRRMEAAHFDRNHRELELTKHVSLRHLDASALLRLRSEGECEFELLEALFDLDFPGHYLRRIKSVSITVPAVVGPYTGVSGTLTLLSSRLRDKAIVSGAYADDANYGACYLPVQSIATSSGQNDSGVFELNFRDERHLPFEFGGVISRWRFKMPGEFRAFDYDTISDLIVHLRYTARDGGETLEAEARTDLAGRLNRLTRAQTPTTGLVELISLRQDFPVEWRKYKHEKGDLLVQLTDQLFPYMFRARVKPERAVLVWKDQVVELEPSPVVGVASSLPGYSVKYVPGADLLSVDDPYLVVTYRV